MSRQILRKQLIFFLMGSILTCLYLRIPHFEDYTKEPVKKHNWTIFCYIQTKSTNHRQVAFHTLQTWVQRCDGHIYFSNMDDAVLPAVAIGKEVNTPDRWNHTTKVLQYLKEHVAGKYDFFLQAGDDTYVIVNNLRRILDKYDPEVPTIIGHKTRRYFRFGIPARGAGYVLSRAALVSMIRGLQTEPSCMKSPFKDFEEMAFASCAYALKIGFVDSVGRNGKSHFWPESPIKVMDRDGMSSKFNFINNTKMTRCCADDMVSFNDVLPAEMYLLHYLIYTVRKRKIK